MDEWMAGSLDGWMLAAGKPRTSGPRSLLPRPFGWDGLWGAGLNPRAGERVGGVWWVWWVSLRPERPPRRPPVSPSRRAWRAPPHNSSPSIPQCRHCWGQRSRAWAVAYQVYTAPSRSDEFRGAKWGLALQTRPLSSPDLHDRVQRAWDGWRWTESREGCTPETTTNQPAHPDCGLHGSSRALVQV